MPPSLALPDTVRALADLTMGFQVSANDPDNNLVEIGMNAFWFQLDSLQAPTNDPSYDGGNPGFFSWAPTEADIGDWIAAFSATDICGKVDTDQVTILVGIPFCGDCTRDTVIDVGDVVYLINYLFKGGTSPNPACQGDANCDDVTDIGDVVLLINYLYKYGSAPCFECCSKLSSGALR